MLTAEFDYDLPSGLIAQEPVFPRDACRLLVLDRASGQIDHRGFGDIGEYVMEGDLLVVNDCRGLTLDERRTTDPLCVRQPYGLWSMSAELDTFLFARGGKPWRC